MTVDVCTNQHAPRLLGLKKAGLISLSWDHVHFMCFFFGGCLGENRTEFSFLVLRWEGKKFNNSPYVGTWHRFGVHKPSSWCTILKVQGDLKKKALLVSPKGLYGAMPVLRECGMLGMM